MLSPHSGEIASNVFVSVFFFYFIPPRLSISCRVNPLHVNMEADQPKETMLCRDCRWISSACFVSPFHLPLSPPHPSLFSEWSLSTTSLGWLATKAQEASSRCLGRSECLFVFLIWGHSKTQLKALQFAGYTCDFSSSDPALSGRGQSSNYTLCHRTWQRDSYVPRPCARLHESASASRR